MRADVRLCTAMLLALCAFKIERAAALTIVPGFDSSITTAPNAADIENSINISAAAMGSLYSNPGTVTILFKYLPNKGFLGSSFTNRQDISYSDYVADLQADAAAHPDNTALASALAHLPTGNDANGAKPVVVTTAYQRIVLGDPTATPCFGPKGGQLATCNGVYDGVITLSSVNGLDFTRPIPAYDSSLNNVTYDAIETEEHEIAEILDGGGYGSTIPSNGAEFGPLDLDRYASSGVPSYTKTIGATAYFSTDGGQTSIVGFSQVGGGADYGDWGPNITACSGGGFGGPGYVQDTDSCNNKQSDVSSVTPEFKMLEALGYDPSAAALVPVIGWNCSVNADPTSYTGTIAAIKVSSCNQVVTGTNSFTGGTNIDTGTLQLGNGGTTGSIVGDVIDSGTLAFDRSDTLIFAGAISGGGTVEQDGTGTTVLTGANTYVGITTVSAGTLQLGNGGTTGSISGDAVVSKNAALAFDRSDVLVYAGSISGQGHVIQFGTGTTILTGDSSFTGGTTIGAGTLQIGDGGADGSILGAVTDNGTLAFDRSDTILFKAQISGSGALAQIGGGTTILTAASSYTGGTFIGAGVLQIGNNTKTGVIVGNVVDNSVLAFDHPDTIAFSGAISGSGAVVQIGSGTLTLTGANSYGGGTLVASGTLEAGASNALGKGAVTLGGATLLLDNGVVLPNTVVIQQASFIDVNGTDVAGLAGGLSGSAPLEKDGTGTLAISGASNYSGNIAFHGTLAVGSTGALGSGTVTVLGSTLVLANAVTYANPTLLADNLSLEQDGGSATVTGPISESGGPWGLTKTGTGTVVLANVNSFTGPTTVAQGTLVVAGMVAGAVVVQPGATLGMTGAAAVGSLSVGGTLSVHFGGASTGFASDRLTVAGGVTLTGGLLDAQPTTAASDFLFDQRYVVIVATGPVGGSFANPAAFTANPSNPALLQRVRFDLGGVVLEVRHLIDFTPTAATPNQAAVAGALSAGEGGAGDNWAGVLNTLSVLPPSSQADALSQMSGEGLIDGTRIAGDGLDLFDDALRSHVVDIAGPTAGAVAHLGQGNTLWIAMLGRGEWAGAHDGYAGFHTEIPQFAVGADTAFDNLTLGLAASTGNPSQRIAALSTSVSGKLTAFGAYARYDLDDFYLNGTLSHDAARLTEQRVIAVGSIHEPVSASFGQQATAASLELDWRLSLFDGDFEPLARVGFVSSRQDGFTEADNGTGLALTVAPVSQDVWNGTLGARWRDSWRSGGVALVPDASAALSLNDQGNLLGATATFAGTPAGTGSFVVTAQHQAPLTAVLGAGLSIFLDSEPVAIGLHYEGHFSGRSDAHSALLNADFAW